MKIHFRYEPDNTRFWLGATDGQGNYQEFALQHWMDVNDVHQVLEESVRRLNIRLLHEVNKNTN